VWLAVLLSISLLFGTASLPFAIPPAAMGGLVGVDCAPWTGPFGSLDRSGGASLCSIFEGAAIVVASSAVRGKSSTGGDMSANQRPEAARKPGAAISARATPLETRIKREVKVGIKRRLGLSEGDRLPDGVQGFVDSAAREVAESSLAISVLREVEAVTKRMDRSRDDRHGTAAVTSYSEMGLLTEAEYLAAKKKALQAAGFSSDEAMRILVAEVSARQP